MKMLSKGQQSTLVEYKKVATIIIIYVFLFVQPSDKKDISQ